MIDILTVPSDLGAILARYDIAPGTGDTHPRLARTAEPQLFFCEDCGAKYASVYVGIHAVKARCPSCVERRRSPDGPTQRADKTDAYAMPPLYARDGSSLLPTVRAWLERPLPALALLHGGPGRGKSAQSHHIGAWCYPRKRFALIGDRDLMRLSDESCYACACADVLVIDEIGRRTTEGVIANVCELIDRRIPYDRKTAIVSNLGAEDLALMDARLTSRFRAADRIAFTGPDLRKPMYDRKMP